jgi:hypothetical protein
MASLREKVPPPPHMDELTAQLKEPFCPFGHERPPMHEWLKESQDTWDTDRLQMMGNIAATFASHSAASMGLALRSVCVCVCVCVLCCSCGA